MVRDFFAQFGFAQIAEKDGETQWALRTDSYRPSRVFIKPLEKETAPAIL